MDTSTVWIIIFLVFFAILMSILLRRKENYQIAKDPESKDMFERLKSDLAKLYPIDKLDLNGLVSCIPEDSFTENKKHVAICLRRKEGDFLPYPKLLKIGIHELAHVMSKGYDPEHKTPEFNNNYAMLMKKASDLGFRVE